MRFRRLSSAIEALQTSEIAQDESSSETIAAVIVALQEWDQIGVENQMLRSILGMKNLVREIEESIQPLLFISNVLAVLKQDVIIVDLCSGKGVFSMLARQTATTLMSARIQKILMVDKQTKGSINLNHLQGLISDKLPPIEFLDADIHTEEFAQALPLLYEHLYSIPILCCCRQRVC